MQLVIFEAEARREGKIAVSSLKAEAEALHRWFLANHKGKQAPTPKTIANNISGGHRRHWSKPRN